MNNKLVSLIIPVYNAEDTLSKCLDSILNQTYKEIEILLINDGSIDKSLKIMQDYAKKDTRIKLINKKNSGVSSTRNKGIKEAKGDYLMFIDSDDYIRNNTISTLVKEIEKNNVDIIRFNGFIENKKGQMLELEFPINNRKILCSPENKIDIIELINHPTKSIRCYSPLLFLKNNDIILFNEELSYLEDKVFYLENLLNNKKIMFLNEYLYYYTYNKKSTTKSIDNYIENIKKIMDSKRYVKDILKKYLYENDNMINTSYSVLILHRLDYLVENVNYNDFKEIFLNIKNELIIEHNNLKYLSKFKSLQYKLLVKKHFFTYYIITKLKVKIK